MALSGWSTCRITPPPLPACFCSNVNSCVQQAWKELVRGRCAAAQLPMHMCGLSSEFEPRHQRISEWDVQVALTSPASCSPIQVAGMQNALSELHRRTDEQGLLLGTLLAKRAQAHAQPAAVDLAAR